MVTEGRGGTQARANQEEGVKSLWILACPRDVRLPGFVSFSSLSLSSLPLRSVVSLSPFLSSLLPSRSLEALCTWILNFNCAFQVQQPPLHPFVATPPGRSRRCLHPRFYSAPPPSRFFPFQSFRSSFARSAKTARHTSDRQRDERTASEKRAYENLQPNKKQPAATSQPEGRYPIGPVADGSVSTVLETFSSRVLYVTSVWTFPTC